MTTSRAALTPPVALQASVGTPPRRAPVATDARGASLKGKIVVYNVPWTGYGPTVQYRSTGASRAAAHGAVRGGAGQAGGVPIRRGADIADGQIGSAQGEIAGSGAETERRLRAAIIRGGNRSGCQKQAYYDKPPVLHRITAIFRLKVSSRPETYLAVMRQKYVPGDTS